MSKPRRELQVLATLNGAALAAGNWNRPAAAAVNGELDSHEVAEVVYLEVVPPLTALGVPEDIIVQLRLDGKVEEYNYIYGIRDLLSFTPKEFMQNGQLHTFGKPMFALSNGFAGVQEALCPKYRRALSFDVFTAAGVTVGYQVRAWGYRYEANTLGQVARSVGGAGTFFDRATSRASRMLNKRSITPSYDTWTQLPGGLDQEVPKFFHFTKVASNANATTANLDYEFRFDTGNVATRQEDLMFQFAIEKKVAVIKGLGVNPAAAATLQDVHVDVGGDLRPKNRWPITVNRNSKFFGNNLVYLGLPTHSVIPLLDDPILVSDENTMVKARDNGAASGANTIRIAVSGIMVEES